MSTITTDDLRAEIDRLDTQLLDLVDERRRISTQIQQLRMAQGGPRVVHAREAEVIGRWREALGTPGTRIAQALLDLSRGPLIPVGRPHHHEACSSLPSGQPALPAPAGSGVRLHDHRAGSCGHP